MPTSPILHVTFDESAAGNLIAPLGVPRDSIISLSDDLSIGPIDRIDGESRGKWWNESLRVDMGGAEWVDRFWAQVEAARRIVAWGTRRSPRDYAGLLALISQREDRPLDVVDVTEIEFLGDDGKRDPVRSMGIGGLPPTQVIDLKLAERAAPLSSSAATSYRQTWTRLQQENALLRVVDGRDLVSVPITHFDSQLVSFATPEWESTKKVIGRFYQSAATAGFRPPNYWLLRSRIVAMVEAGALEGKGDFVIEPPRDPESWVRRLGV